MIRTVLLLLASVTLMPVGVRDIDGKVWTLLSPARGQLDLLFFISSDCPISNRYAPEIQRICSDYQARGVRCFAVYPDALDAKTVTRHRQEYGFGAAMPAIIDREHSLVRAVGARVTPEAALFSGAGRVYRGRIDDMYIDVGRSRRAPTQQDLRLALDAALGGKPVAAAETEAVGCFIQAS